MLLCLLLFTDFENLPQFQCAELLIRLQQKFVAHHQDHPVYNNQMIGSSSKPQLATHLIDYPN